MLLYQMTRFNFYLISFLSFFHSCKISCESRSLWTWNDSDEIKLCQFLPKEAYGHLKQPNPEPGSVQDSWHWNSNCWILSLPGYHWRSPWWKGTFAPFPPRRSQLVTMGLLSSAPMFEKAESRGGPCQATQFRVRAFRIQQQRHHHHHFCPPPPSSSAPSPLWIALLLAGAAGRPAAYHSALIGAGPASMLPTHAALRTSFTASSEHLAHGTKDWALSMAIFVHFVSVSLEMRDNKPDPNGKYFFRKS